MQQNANNKTMLFYKYKVYVYLYLNKSTLLLTH